MKLRIFSGFAILLGVIKMIDTNYYCDKYKDMEYDLKITNSNTNNDKLNIQKEIYGILSGKADRIDDPSVEHALIDIKKTLTKIQDYINKE